MADNNDNVEVDDRKQQAMARAREIAIEKVRQILDDECGSEIYQNLMATFQIATEEEKTLEMEVSPTAAGIIAIAMMTAKGVADAEG